MSKKGVKPRAAKVPVTMRALIQRINRKLQDRDEVLKITRGTHAWTDLGDYYRLDVNRNCIVATHVDPEALGRELGALQSWERVADAGQ